MTVTVKSAIQLSSTQLDAVKKEAAKKYGKDVVIENIVDASLIGGVQLIVGSRLLDGSLRGKLEQLKQSIQSNS